MPSRLRQDKNDHALKVLLAYMQQHHEGQAKSAAKKLQVSRSMLSEVQAGTRGFGLKLLDALARETGLSIEQVTGGEPLEDAGLSHSDLARRQFLGLFQGAQRAEAERYMAEKDDEAARLPSGWSAYDLLSRYWIPGFDAWRALQRGKAVAVDADVEDMDEAEATPAFARKRAAK